MDNPLTTVYQNLFYGLLFRIEVNCSDTQGDKCEIWWNMNVTLQMIVTVYLK
jgi:hypothetical protein